MNIRVEPPVGAEAESAPSHLVIKRGHHGRYRFSLMLGTSRLSGEVRIDTTAERAAQDEAARIEIKRLVAALAARLEEER